MTKQMQFIVFISNIYFWLYSFHRSNIMTESSAILFIREWIICFRGQRLNGIICEWGHCPMTHWRMGVILIEWCMIIHELVSLVNRAKWGQWLIVSVVNRVNMYGFVSIEKTSGDFKKKNSYEYISCTFQPVNGWDRTFHVRIGFLIPGALPQSEAHLIGNSSFTIICGI